MPHTRSCTPSRVFSSARRGPRRSSRSLLEHRSADGTPTGASIWRTPRSRSLLLLGTLALVAGAVAFLAHEYTELLWFRELGQEGTFWATLKWRVLGYGVPTFATASIFLVNFAVVERVMARHTPQRPHRRLVYPLAAAAAGAISGEWLRHGTWQLLALWAGRSDVGATDPLFHRDVSFYLLSLPLYEQAARWLLVTLALTAAATVAAYLAAGGLRTARPHVIVRAARAHLLTLAAIALLTIAWRIRLDQFTLALPHEGSVVPGASYTDVHVRLPARRALTVLGVTGAGLCLYAAWRRVLVVPAAAVAVLAGLAIAAESTVPAVIERFDVQPQVLSREEPYLADAIRSTRRAYGLDHVSVRSPPAGSRVSAAEVARSRLTFENVPLWDASVLKPAMNELQAIGRYYRFASTAVDRYMVDGVPRLMSVAARELDRSGLGAEGRGWTNDRFAYTHGYGAVAVRAGKADSAGRPHFVQRGFASTPNPLGLREPRIYFGEQGGSDPPYLVVGSSRGEVDAPIPGNSAPGYHYDGPAGISVSGLGRRAAFAARFGDLKLLLTETIGDSARIVLHRDVGERLRMLAPFLTWDEQPQTAVIGGRVAYLFHGYTMSDHYPYSAPVRVGSRRVNYLRAPVQAMVDAFTGQVSIYVTDADDPILRTWRATYPDLFLPASRMPSELRAHLRYPRALFEAQTDVYATYHAGDPTGFWNGADAWRRPPQLAGPIESAGEIHFPAEKGKPMQPDYEFARMPGDTRERLMLVTPFSPRGRENLTAFLAGTIDADGRPQLTMLSLPRDRLTVGPSQATRRILASPPVNRRLELLNRESRDLGKAAVNRTILGVAHMVPVGDSLVHVQPVYVVSGGGGLPELQLVTVYADGRVGYGRDLHAALRRALGRAAAAALEP